MGFLLPFKKNALVNFTPKPSLPIRNKPDVWDDVVFEVMSRDCLDTPPGEPRLPVLISCDTSDSTNQANAINQLNHGIYDFLDAMATDISCRSTLQVAIAKFGAGLPFELVVPFKPVADITPPVFVASGLTPFCEHVIEGIEVAIKHRTLLSSVGQSDARATTYVAFTDGGATDLHLKEDLLRAITERATEANVAVYLFGIGEAADMDFLNSVSQPGRPAQHVSLLNIEAIFDWLKNSLRTVSASIPGQIISVTGLNGQPVQVST